MPDSKKDGVGPQQEHEDDDGEVLGSYLWLGDSPLVERWVGRGGDWWGECWHYLFSRTVIDPAVIMLLLVW